MRLFVNEIAIKAKAPVQSEAPPRTPLGSFQRSLNPPSWCNWV